MIVDRKFDRVELENFLKLNSDEFIPSLKEQLDSFYYGNMTIEQFALKLSQKATVSVKYEGNHIMGMVIGYTHNTPDEKSYISYVIVGRQYRGKGIAVELINDYFAYAKKQQLKSVWLKTTVENVIARKLYEKVGMKLMETSDGLVIYEKQL
ncbi:MAG: GNAT family N-acetyltransferase [Lachnospiraceae bacterium]|nr:GNAT family N-acetyltransferase [Lachnospiraceae bacterium]